MPAAAGTQQPPPVPTLVPQGAHAGQRPMTLNRLFTGDHRGKLLVEA